MSSVRGAFSRGRGRGSTQQPSARGRGASNSRGRVFNNTSSRGDAANRGTFGENSRQNGGRLPRSTNAPRENTFNSRTPSTPSAVGGAKTTGSWQDRFQTLIKARERERADAIRNGIIADPEKPRSLADAITLVGTCQDMCPEFERVQRVVQSDVWDEERDTAHSAYAPTEPGPDESRMVKKFRRSAAGLEEQMPSDLRPPPVLKRTCDYLFDDMIGNAASLANVHHFVWDRTRAIRNDFSIQQVSKPEELRIAVECFERIARFHIMSLHQLALPEKPYSKYDHQQEREQLDRTLLSLVQLYDDNRGRIPLPNEAEFRAYCVILQLQDPTPDLEDRIQTWPRHILRDQRVQKALEVYMAACNVMDSQGPLKPRTTHLIARQDWQKFWTLVASKEVSYLMACTAEVYFYLIRRMVMNALLSAAKRKRDDKTPDWTIDELRDLLAFDEYDEVYTYCEKFGFSFGERDDGQHYLDLSSVSGRTLPEPEAGIPKQSKSSLVEDKRFGRSLPAMINGFTVKQAQDAGLVTEREYEEEMDMEDADAMDSGNQHAVAQNAGSSDTIDDGESLFVPERKTSSFSKPQEPISGFGVPNGTTGASTTAFSGFSFGKPSAAEENSNALVSPMTIQASGSANNAPKFDFRKPSTEKTPATTSSAFNFLGSAPSNSTSNVKPVSNSFAFGGSSQSTESILSKPATARPTTAPSLFQFPNAPATSESTNAKETVPPVSNASDLFNAAPPVAPPKQEGPETSSLGNHFSFTQPAGSSPAPLPRQPSQSPELKASQPHLGTSQSPNLNAHNATNGLNSGVRKSSFSRDHRPEKPSPLSNSFTAGEDSAIVDNYTAVNVPLNQQPQGLFQTPQPQNFNTGSIVKEQPTSRPDPAVEDMNRIVADITDNLFNDPTRGLLQQYIEFHVRQTVRDECNKFDAKNLREEADRHCFFRLQKKYGQRWREIFWRRRLAKTGRERRARRQQRLRERSSERGSLLDGASSLAQSQGSSVSGAEEFGIRQSVEDMFGQSRSDTRTVQPANNVGQTHAGVKRPVSSHGLEDASQSRQHAHKRMKSTSHVDDRGRVTKPSVTSNPHNDILRRSAFLSFSQDSLSGGSQNTTKTNYFKHKALGLHRIDDPPTPRGTKRPSLSRQETAQTSPPALRESLLRSTSALSNENDKASMPPPSLTPVRTSKTNNQDEALFARIKAAREKLGDTKALTKSDMATSEDFHRSLNSSRSSNEFESPSMARARLEARMRASQGPSEGGASVRSRDVPAYRLRESRFVPSEDYGKAIDRAREIRESRSRDTSRAESPQAPASTSQQPKNRATTAPSSGFPGATSMQSPLFKSSTNGSNGLASRTTQQTQSAFAPSTITNSFGAQATQATQAPLSFANHNTQMSTENPFLKAAAGNTFGGFGTQQTEFSKGKQPDKPGPHDFTTQPTQINEALANSFGSSHVYGSNQLLSVQQEKNTPPQQDSYLHSQVISLMSDDEDDEAPQSTQHASEEGQGDTEADEELYDEASEDEQPAALNGHINPYMALARSDNGDEDEEDLDSQMEDEEGYDEDHEDALNGYIDDEATDGDIDEDETQEMEDHDEAYGYGDEEGESHYQWGMRNQEYEDGQYAANPPKSSALQSVGNTAEEAIELSD